MKNSKPHGLTGRRNAAKPAADRLYFRPAVRLSYCEKLAYKHLCRETKMTERELFMSRFPEITE